MKRKGITGDQINISNNSGSYINVAGGDIHQSIVNSKKTESIEEFVRLFREIQTLVNKSNLSSSTKGVIKSDLSVVDSQLESGNPKKDLIVNRLKSALELIITMGSAAKAGEVISSMLQKAVEMAQTVL